MTDHGLLVGHDEDRYVGRPGDAVTFGRGTGVTVRIGMDDLHVHRLVGSFVWANGNWVLNNEGNSTTLAVAIDGGLQATIAVGAHPLILPTGATGTVRILTPSPYVLAIETGTGDGQFVDSVELGDDLDSPTIDVRQGLGLSDAEFDMLVALCEPRLLDPSLPAFTVPSTKDVCERLGIPAKRAEDIIDSLVTKVTPFVDGVSGSNQGRAMNRRHRIAAFALETRCVVPRDLRILDVSP